METEKQLYQVDTATNTIFDRIRKYLAKNYQLRFNEIALEFEIKTENGDWTELNLNSLYIELTQAGINIAFNKLEILMRSHLITVFNPFENYFQNLEKWDGENQIQRLTSFVKTTDTESFQIHFEKWLTRSVLCAFEKRLHQQTMLRPLQYQAKQWKDKFFEIPDSAKFGEILHRRYWCGQRRTHCALQKLHHQYR